MEETVLSILSEVCEDDVVKEDRDINIVEENLIDSLGYMELLADIEEKLGVVIAPSEFTREQMDTPNKIIEIVIKKQAE
ncbi:MAG: D-alanine--poly(phosphoribitol) ligase subunit 2 [Catonella sp.]|jgi:D-alanine--poly(phosphoribitol) ligase subunit 2|nr:D-alanine--poly(phosphoribitol) ligase subunit 2 [Catonella sp.]MDY6357316.1 D-alanine--poly(phosphoribitol) ligase subunit 2 [Catonella sp.]